MAYIAEAKAMVEKLTAWESCGTGDLQLALERVAIKHNLPKATLWSIKYRPPKGIFWDVFEKLSAAYAEEYQRQAQKLADEIEITRPFATSDSTRSVILQAESVVCATV